MSFYRGVQTAFGLFLLGTAYSVTAASLMDEIGMCIAPREAGSPNSRAAVAERCASTSARSVTLTALGEIRTGPWCLGIADASTMPLARVVWAGCIGTINLLWKFEDGRILSLMHGLCLTRNYRTSKGIDQYVMLECDGRSAQKWRIFK